MESLSFIVSLVLIQHVVSIFQLLSKALENKTSVTLHFCKCRSKQVYGLKVMIADSISAYLEKPRTARYTVHVEAVLVVTLMIVTLNVIKEVCTTFH